VPKSDAFFQGPYLETVHEMIQVEYPQMFTFSEFVHGFLVCSVFVHDLS
jgi:hypothetical protein